MMSYQRLAVAAILLSLLAAGAEARKAELLPKSTGAKLRHAAKAREKVSLPDLPLGRGSALDTIELEPMELWAPGAKIVVHGEEGTKSIDPPDARYFRGAVKGDPQSAVFLAVADKKMHGLVVSGGKRFALGTARRADKGADDDTVGLRELDDEDDPSPGGWTCDVESKPLSSLDALTAKSDATPRDVKTSAGAVGNARFQFKLAIETDWELYAAFFSVDGLTTYLESLVGNASVIFQRDLGTTLVIGSIQIHTIPSDPWTRLPTNGTIDALAEVANMWHDDPARAQISRSAVVMVSGKPFNAGRAFQGTLCGADFACGPDGVYCGNPGFRNGGAYAFCGTNGQITTTVPDPTATRDGITYAMPSTNDYWMLYLFMHEVGHLANGPHTNCVGLTYDERFKYGVERGFIDECVTGVPPCSSATAKIPAELGTIMSGCHALFTDAGRRAARYLFWEAGRPSEKMRAILHEGLDGATPDAAIRLGTYSNPNEEDPQPIVCNSGRTARVASCTSCTYAWTISGVTVTSATNTTTITYTPAAPLVTLGVTITNPSGCAITTSRAFRTACAALPAPGSFNATQNEVGVELSWSPVTGAAGYEVWRSNGTTWTAIGATKSTSFLDLTAAAGGAYLYRVRGLDADGYAGAFSARDFASTFAFTDPVLAPHASLIRAVHVAELRAAVNAIRALAGLATASFTDPDLAQANIKRVHIQELRTRLDEANTALARPATSYTDPGLNGASIVRAEHVAELRAAVR